MKVIDAHCDVLLKLSEQPSLSFYQTTDQLQVQYSYMEKANIAIQAFALFVSPDTPSQMRLQKALQMIDVFYEQVVRENKVVPIYSAKDVNQIMNGSGASRGGILTLEGAEALEGNIVHLRTLHRLGVRALGFTWNYRNEAADGVEEPNPGGLSLFGRKVLKECNRLGMILDVSHLSEKGFWDVAELSSAPFMASHSNCKSILPHARNLNDEQIRTIYRKNGVLGLTFVPYFVSDGKQVVITDLLKHLDYALSLGGEDHIAFGSDFDGIPKTMRDLRRLEDYTVLINTLLRHYKEDQVKKWLHGNWQRLFSEVLG